MPSAASAGPMDWYSFLGVGPEATTEQIATAVERLSRQANALALTAPERARQLRDQARAVKQDLLSGPESRQRYDQGLATRAASNADAGHPDPAPTPGPAPGPPPATGPQPAPGPQPYPGQQPAPGPQPYRGLPGPAPYGYPAAPPTAYTPYPGPPRPAGWNPGAVPSNFGPQPAAPQPPRPQPPRPQPPGAQAPGLMSRISKFLQTGWTCVACGYGAQPTDKFCPKCGNRIESGLGDLSPHTSRAGQTGVGPPNAAPEPQAARCDKCGTWATAGDTFCMRCGRGLVPGISGN